MSRSASWCKKCQIIHWSGAQVTCTQLTSLMIKKEKRERRKVQSRSCEIPLCVHLIEQTQGKRGVYLSADAAGVGSSSLVSINAPLQRRRQAQIGFEAWLESGIKVDGNAADSLPLLRIWAAFIFPMFVFSLCSFWFVFFLISHPGLVHLPINSENLLKRSLELCSGGICFTQRAELILSLVILFLVMLPFFFLRKFQH